MILIYSLIKNNMKSIDIRVSSINFWDKLDKLKKIYNIKANSKLIAHIVDLELNKHNITFTE